MNEEPKILASISGGKDSLAALITHIESGGRCDGAVYCRITNRGLYCGEVTETPRAQSHGALPIVAGFKHKAGAKAGNIGFEVERAPTLSAEQTSAVIDCRELAAIQPEPLVMATSQARAEILKGIEGGTSKVENTSLKNALALADALGVHPRDLI